MTALYAASDEGHDEIVRVLLAAKAIVNTQDKVGFFVHTFPTCTNYGITYRIAIYGGWEVVN